MDRKSFWFLILPIVFFLPSLLFSAIPSQINYQGRMTLATKLPFTGTADFFFSIYDAQTAGNLKWTNTHLSVPIVRGVFNVVLGSVTPINLTFYSNYWLDIRVNSVQMDPRRPLLSAPYAFRSRYSDQADTVAPGITNTLHGVLSIEMLSAISLTNQRHYTDDLKFATNTKVYAAISTTNQTSKTYMSQFATNNKVYTAISTTNQRHYTDDLKFATNSKVLATNLAAKIFIYTQISTTNLRHYTDDLKFATNTKVYTAISTTNQASKTYMSQFATNNKVLATNLAAKTFIYTQISTTNLRHYTDDLKFATNTKVLATNLAAKTFIYTQISTTNQRHYIDDLKFATNTKVYTAISTTNQVSKTYMSRFATNSKVLATNLATKTFIYTQISTTNQRHYIDDLKFATNSKVLATNLAAKTFIYTQISTTNQRHYTDDLKFATNNKVLATNSAIRNFTTALIASSTNNAVFRIKGGRGLATNLNIDISGTGRLQVTGQVENVNGHWVTYAPTVFDAPPGSQFYFRTNTTAGNPGSFGEILQINPTTGIIYGRTMPTTANPPNLNIGVSGTGSLNRSTFDLATMTNKVHNAIASNDLTVKNLSLLSNTGSYRDIKTLGNTTLVLSGGNNGGNIELVSPSGGSVIYSDAMKHLWRALTGLPVWMTLTNGNLDVFGTLTASNIPATNTLHTVISGQNSASTNILHYVVKNEITNVNYNNVAFRKGFSISRNPSVVNTATNSLQIGDASFYIMNSTPHAGPLFNFDPNDYMSYSRSANQFGWTIGGTNALNLLSYGLNVPGRLSVNRRSTFTSNIQVNNGGATIQNSAFNTALTLKSTNADILVIDGTAPANLQNHFAMKTADNIWRMITVNNFIDTHGGGGLYFTLNSANINSPNTNTLVMTRQATYFYHNTTNNLKIDRQINYVTPMAQAAGAQAVNIAAGGTGQLYMVTSSRRYKTNILPLKDEFDRVLLAEPRTFKYKEQKQRGETNVFGIGYIAEDIDALGLKNLVIYKSNGQIESLSYPYFTIYQLEVAKRHDKEIKALQKEISDLKTRQQKETAELNRKIKLLEADREKWEAIESRLKKLELK